MTGGAQRDEAPGWSPMVPLALAFGAGVWCLQQQAQLPSPLWGFGLAIAALLLVPVMRGAVAHARWAALLLAVALVSAAGFLYASWRAHLRLAVQLPAALEGTDLRIEGVVAEMPQASARGLRFVFEVENFSRAERRLPDRVSLTWYEDDDQASAAMLLHAGQRWHFTVRLRRPHGAANPHGFDSELWLLERGIRATGYVRVGDQRLLDPMVHRPALWIERIREAARTRIRNAIEDPATAALLTALSVGDQQGISAAQWTVFTRTGVNHLISISGLHITMLAGLVLTMTLRLWSWLPVAPLRIPAQRVAALCALLAALVYALLAGFSVPAQRTVYMLGVVTAALCAGRRAAGSDILALALVVVLLVDPWAVMAVGFWLSFGAVGLIMYVANNRSGPIGSLRSWVTVQWAVTVGLAPVTIAVFQQLSLVSPVANAFAIPAISLAVVPLTLLGLVIPFDVLLGFVGVLAQWCVAALTWLSALPQAVWQQHAPSSASLMLALCGVAWLLAPSGWPARWLGLLAMLPLVHGEPRTPAHGRAWVDVLDVGQGLAVVVRTHAHVLVYDTGPAYADDSDSGSRIVVPHLRAEGVRSVDALIVTHGDKDHSGGAHSIFDAVPVGAFLSSMGAGEIEAAALPVPVPCVAGQRWEWDGVAFTVVHPLPDGYNASQTAGNDAYSNNDSSCVLRIDATGGRLLLTGDIERKAEELLLSRYGSEALRADVLLVPHHGSTTSSTSDFVRRVHPAVALFTVGYRNRFGHPAAAVLQRYRDIGSRAYRSDRDGAVMVRLDDSIRIETWRSLHARYWQGK